ncbi:MAG TPA: DUF1287 domain-containing protein [Ignavibacteria bacterium]
MKYIIQILFVANLFYSCTKKEVSPHIDSKKKIDSTITFNLTENQKKVLEGAKKCLEAKFNYDMDMAYHVLKYRDGEYTGSKVYPNGDLDPTLGVCTEVTIRALRWGGVCDLQEEIYNDIKANWSDYPMSRWNAKKPDQNIDHRRVPNQLIWFKKNWLEIPAGKYQAGDVVIWDMNHDSWADHIGIMSDKYTPEGEGTLMIIHNFPSPSYVAEEDMLGRWEIVGVFRVR